MPKFYRQNKKRIDPRYFLEETVDRDNPIEEYYGYGEYSWGPGGTTSYGNNDYDRQATRKKQMAFNAQNFLERLRKLDNRTSPAEVDKQALSALIDKVENTATGSDKGLSDDEYNQLDAAMKDESSIRAFDRRVIAMLSTGSGDTDGDGTSDADELIKIAKGMQDNSGRLSEMSDSDRDDIEGDAKKLQAVAGDWDKVKSTYQDAYDANGELTDYGKAVEDKYKELEGSLSARIKRATKNLLGISKTASKTDKAFKQSGAFTNKRGRR